MEGGFGLVLFILAAIFYFIPTVIACKREAGHTGTIFFINLLFGWTVPGMDRGADLGDRREASRERLRRAPVRRGNRLAPQIIRG
jgi:hypothetical protein